jgi:hypothetical protein
MPIAFVFRPTDTAKRYTLAAIMSDVGEIAFPQALGL